MNKIPCRVSLLCSIIGIGDNRLESLSLDGCHSIDLNDCLESSPYALPLSRFYSHILARITNKIQSLTFDIPHIPALLRFEKQNKNGIHPNLTHLKVLFGKQRHNIGIPYSLSKLLLSYLEMLL